MYVSFNISTAYCISIDGIKPALTVMRFLNVNDFLLLSCSVLEYTNLKAYVMDKFKLTSDFKPKGDQPEAIEKLSNNILKGINHQVLLGVTGSGKTFTMANVIEKVQKPTLVMAHNKTLAAQLYSEFKF